MRIRKKRDHKSNSQGDKNNSFIQQKENQGADQTPQIKSPRSSLQTHKKQLQKLQENTFDFSKIKISQPENHNQNQGASHNSGVNSPQQNVNKQGHIQARQDNNSSNGKKGLQIGNRFVNRSNIQARQQAPIQRQTLVNQVKPDVIQRDLMSVNDFKTYVTIVRQKVGGGLFGRGGTMQDVEKRTPLKVNSGSKFDDIVSALDDYHSILHQYRNTREMSTDQNQSFVAIDQLMLPYLDTIKNKIDAWDKKHGKWQTKSKSDSEYMKGKQIELLIGEMTMERQLLIQEARMEAQQRQQRLQQEQLERQQEQLRIQREQEQQRIERERQKILEQQRQKREEQQRILEEYKKEQLRKIQEENAFATANLQPNPNLRSGDEENHQLKEQVNTKVNHFLNKGTYVYSENSWTPLSMQIQIKLVPNSRQYDNNNKKFSWEAMSDFGQITVFESDIQETKTVTPSERFHKVNAELFPNGADPDPNDIRQTNLGDCYLQSALMSIATSRPQYFKTIMRDQGDTVTVRLYRVDKTNQDDPQYTAQYIKVEKSIPQSSTGSQLYNRGKLWVKMMQKAYVAGRFAGSLQDEAKIQNQTTSYSNIRGGFEGHVFEVLMGKESKSISIVNQTVDNNPAKAQQSILYALSKYGIGQGSQVTKKIMEHLVQQSQIQQQFNGRVSIQINLQDIQNAFAYGNMLEQQKMDLVLEELKGVLPGSLGSGSYTQKQLEIYGSIKQALLDHKPVTIGTNKYVKAQQGGFAGYAGEQKSGGLAGSHAYSVLNVCTSDQINVPDLEKVNGRYKLVQLRNPWGHYGRHYQNLQNGGGTMGYSRDDQGGVFWVDLSEITKYFDEVSIGALIPRK